jgi:hypothetical protein
MRNFLMLAASLCILASALSPVARAQEKAVPSGRITLKLTGGDTLSGTPGPVKDGSVSIVTDYGVVRVPVEKLTEESKAKLGVTGDGDVAALRKRILELEALVERLREENAELRKLGQTAPAVPSPAVRPNPAISPSTGTSKTPEPTAATGGYKLSSTGKRHNSRCRYYSSAGRACGPTEGAACKVCGG